MEIIILIWGSLKDLFHQNLFIQTIQQLTTAAFCCLASTRYIYTKQYSYDKTIG